MSDGLDASFAVLSDVSARNRALQARLRSSLPLLWKNDALVLTNAASRRRRPAHSSVFTSDQERTEADGMLLALEDTTHVQASRRYRRRVEWEVARRIARVDRELQQYPPGQRFWNRRKAEIPKPTNVTYRRGGGGGTNVKEKTEEVRRVNNAGAGQRNGGGATTENGRRSNNSAVRSGLSLGVTSERRRVQTDVATSPHRVYGDRSEDKENETVNVSNVGRVEKRAVWRSPSPTKSTDNQPPSPMDELKAASNEIPLHNEPTDDEPEAIVETAEPVVEAAPEPVVKAWVPPVQNELDGPRQTDDVMKENHEDKKVEHIEERKMSESDAASEEWGSPTAKAQTEKRSSSSIGRQVLSEFRTMPSVASFGARPEISTGGLGGPGNKRLNADVLRRLFSDLDSDHDGHVNRVETCMALHRLQISVPTTKIISFFRHIHSPTGGKRVRSRRAQHAPMNEVINYKEFVAFVTAAYDQQQQQKVRRNNPPRQQPRSAPHEHPPPPTPSTSLPIFAKPISTNEVASLIRHSPTMPAEREGRVYELHPDDEVESFEEGVIRSIPDILVTRVMTEAEAPAIRAKDQETALKAVRQSLESFVGKEAIDDKTVSEIAQELLRDQLRALGTSGRLDADEDVTGLERAAAYYNQQADRDDAVSDSVVDDSSPKDLESWVEILTEEQVSGVVQQLWKNRERKISLAQPEIEEAAESAVDIIKRTEDSSQLVDQATDTYDLTSGPTEPEDVVPVTTSDTADTASEVQPAMDTQESTVPASKSVDNDPQLGAIMASLSNNIDMQDLFAAATSMYVLQQQHRRVQISAQEQPANSFQIGDANSSEKAAVNEEAVNFDPSSAEEESESAPSQVSQSDQELEKSSSVLNKSAPMVIKVVDSISNMSSSMEDMTPRSLSVSSSVSNSTLDDHRAYGIYHEISQHHHRYRRYDQRRGRKSVLSSRSGSSIPDSVCSAELSEGELDGEEAVDLSDGEIFGEYRRTYLRRKRVSREKTSIDGSDGFHSSIESGEMPRITKTHARFRRRLVARSTSSSVESGEVEDGALSESLPTASREVHGV